MRLPLSEFVENGPRGERGTSAVEFALVSPVLLLLLFGIMVYGGYLGLAHAVQDAASQAARAAVGGLDTDERIKLATEAARRSAASNPMLSIAAMKVQAGADPSDADRFNVTISYDLSQTVVAAAPKFVPVPKDLVRTASVRRGGA